MHDDTDRGFGPRKSFAPVQVGEELDVTIEAVGEKGDGLAKKKGFVLFVPNTKAGQHVKIRVTKVLRKLGFAEVIGDAKPGEQAQPEAKEPSDSDSFGEESEDKSEDAGEEDEPEDEPENEPENEEEQF